MDKDIFTQDLKNIIKYIKNKILTKYPYSSSRSIYFILGIIENDSSVGYNILLKNLMMSQLDEIKEQCYDYLDECNQFIGEQDLILTIEEDIISYVEKIGKKTSINTGDILLYLIENDEYSMNIFKKYGVSSKHISNDIEDVKSFIDEKDEQPKKHVKNKKNSTTPKLLKNTEKNNLDKQLLNINNLANENKINNVIGNEQIFETIFKTFLKRKNNNVILVGESGVGKTATVKHIANLIVNNNVPKNFEDKILMELDYSSLVSGMKLRGALESKILSIIEDAKRYPKYIFFIDNFDMLMNGPRFDDGPEMLARMITEENNISFIVTATPKGYSSLMSEAPMLMRKFSKIEIHEPNEETSFNILKDFKEVLENYHSVKYDDNAVKTCVKLCKRYLNEHKLPSIAIDVLDEAGAEKNLIDFKDENIETLKTQLIDTQNEKQYIINENTHKNIDKIDELTKKEIQLKSLINLYEKTLDLNKEPIPISSNEIAVIISKKTGIPLSKIDENDKVKLKTLNNTLKNIIIGQNEAIDEVCKVVKRQRIGLSNQNRPSVLLFTGSTGTGKTYLAKKLAEHVFGDEKYMIRLDMSEYSDKMASSKLIGSSAGYIGYDDGGILTEAIKKNKYCVLLLDECEKADESVFNMFLQVFDDGRLTDNKGVTVDFKNVIVIMTSNVGAQEVSERNGGVGFNKEQNINDFEKKIFEKAIKRNFKPEFVNRIDKIVYFNKLTTDNLKDIVRLEVKKVDNKLKLIGYALDSNSYDKITSTIIENLNDKTEYGARPIVRELQKVLEDKITDLIIENDIEEGHCFTYDEIFN